MENASNGLGSIRFFGQFSFFLIGFSQWVLESSTASRLTIGPKYNNSRISTKQTGRNKELIILWLTSKVRSNRCSETWGITQKHGWMISLFTILLIRNFWIIWNNYSLFEKSMCCTYQKRNAYYILCLQGGVDVLYAKRVLKWTQPESQHYLNCTFQRHQGSYVSSFAVWDGYQNLCRSLEKGLKIWLRFWGSL